MALHLTPFQQTQNGDCLPALFNGMRAALVERAATGRMQRIGRLPLNADDFAPVAGVQAGRSREQRTGVGMQGPGKYGFLGPGFQYSNLAVPVFPAIFKFGVKILLAVPFSTAFVKACVIIEIASVDAILLTNTSGFAW